MNDLHFAITEDKPALQRGTESGELRAQQRRVASYRAIDNCLRAVGKLHQAARETADVSNHMVPDQLKQQADRERAVYAEVLALLEVLRKKIR
jgi:hypothetical protein